MDTLKEAHDSNIMIEMLEAKINFLKQPDHAEEEKYADIDKVIDDPQNQADPYDQAKEMIDSFRLKMLEIEQNERLIIQEIEKSI